MLPLLFLFLSEVAAEGGLGPSLTPDEALKCKGGCEGGGRGLGEARTLGSCGAQVGQHPGLEEEVIARLQTERPSGLLQEPQLGQQRRPSGSQPTMGSPVIRSPRDCSEPLRGFLPALAMWQIRRVWDKPDGPDPSTWELMNNRLVKKGRSPLSDQ